MSGLWETVATVAFFIVAICASCAAPFGVWWLADQYLPSRFHWTAWLSVPLGLFVVAFWFGLLFWQTDKDDRDAHRWRNGSGPNTVCHYTEEWVGVAGKGGHMQTFTVCEDAR